MNRRDFFIFVISILILSGCKTTEEIQKDRSEFISKMDNLDICYNLGRQDNFEYWKMILNEQIRRQVKNHWDVTDYICNEATIIGRNALDKKLLRKREFIESLDDSINEATNAVAKGYENAAKAYD